MRKLFFLLTILVTGIFITPVLYTHAQINQQIAKQQYRNGDIIFQTSHSKQCEAVKLATHSKYTHCGMLFQEGNNWYVLEAVEPVQIVPFASWIARGEQGHYVIKRLKKEYNYLDQEKTIRMYELGKRWVGKQYDIYFNWSDEQIYCSELVWKLYHAGAKIDICPLRKMREFDLSSPLVKGMMKERYGNNIPLDASMVAPSDLFDSKKLELVEEQ